MSLLVQQIFVPLSNAQRKESFYICAQSKIAQVYNTLYDLVQIIEELYCAYKLKMC